LFRINKPDSPKVSCDAVESNGADSAEVAAASGTEPELYCMEEACPHLGAPLSHAELEVDDIEDTRAVGGCCNNYIHTAWLTISVCPWHQYDFGEGFEPYAENPHADIISRPQDRFEL